MGKGRGCAQPNDDPYTSVTTSNVFLTSRAPHRGHATTQLLKHVATPSRHQPVFSNTGKSAEDKTASSPFVYKPPTLTNSTLNLSSSVISFHLLGPGCRARQCSTKAPSPEKPNVSTTHQKKSGRRVRGERGEGRNGTHDTFAVQFTKSPERCGHRRTS